MKRILLLTLAVILTFGMCGGASALNIVATMPNVWDVTQEIGGSSVTVIYAAPPTAVHISSDTIDAVLQKNSNFIQDADLVIGQGGGMDSAAITKLTEFAETNFGKKLNWNLMIDVPASAVPETTNVYDNPTSLTGYAKTICWILQENDPANASVYEANLKKYLAKISSVTKLSEEESDLLSKTPIICHFRIKNQAETWLGMNVITSYPQPQTVQAIIDDIHADASKYQAIAASSPNGKIYVVENIVAGQDIGKGIYEALTDENIPCERVIFLNLPKSANGINSILDYYSYNKNLITKEFAENKQTAAQTESPAAALPVLSAALAGALLLTRRK